MRSLFQLLTAASATAAGAYVGVCEQELSCAALYVGGFGASIYASVGVIMAVLYAGRCLYDVCSICRPVGHRGGDGGGGSDGGGGADGENALLAGVHVAVPWAGERGHKGWKKETKKQRNKETQYNLRGGSFCMQWARGRSHYPA